MHLPTFTEPPSLLVGQGGEHCQRAQYHMGLRNSDYKQGFTGRFLMVLSSSLVFVPVLRQFGAQLPQSGPVCSWSWMSSCFSFFPSSPQPSPFPSDSPALLPPSPWMCQEGLDTVETPVPVSTELPGQDVAGAFSGRSRSEQQLFIKTVKAS